MNKKNNGFSLIEIIVATSIITISVFGVYKLIGENTKIINKSINNIQVNNMLFISKECIENIGFENYNRNVGQEYYFNFGNNLDKCNTGTIDNKIILDNLEYSVKSKISAFGDDYIDWIISIESSEFKTLTGSYKQIKK